MAAKTKTKKKKKKTKKQPRTVQDDINDAIVAINDVLNKYNVSIDIVHDMRVIPRRR